MSLPLVEVLRRSYLVAGQSVTFSCGDEWLAERVRRLIAGWHFAAQVDPKQQAFTLHLSREPAPPIPRGLKAFPVHHGQCHSDGSSMDLATSDSLIRVHAPGMRRVDIWIGSETAGDSTAFARVMFYATQAALRQCGLFEVHAAAVIPPAGDGAALIIGPSGSGKTTLAMRLTAAGWSNIADDLVLIREDPGAAEAFAFRRVFAATETTLEACPTPGIEEATREPNDFEPHKRRLDPELLYPGRFVSSGRPGILVFPVITGETQTETEPMSSPEALIRLLKNCPWASYDTAVARPHLSALARLARQCASYALRAGTDLLNDPRAAPRLFDSLPAGAR